jgi:hypothetical protein
MNKLLRNFIPIATGIMLTLSPALGADLTSYRWKKRLMLVFSADTSEAEYVAFNQSLKQRLSEVQDRELIILRIFEKAPSRIMEQPLQPEEAEKLRRRFSIKSGQLTVILIGKDGGVKMVKERRADIQEIFDLIDSMPMRQREMRKSGRIP